MQTTYSILPTLRKEKRKNSQHVLVLIRITVDGQRAEISVKRKIDPGRWDSHANKMRGIRRMQRR